ncbi:hypothetical protein CROQUDRAFT_101558 [Cronartium quercuum f. sp. fusiforme G11]|uniref:Uncharacterized protein n=1 Tax=Cronartium quercuum f. sp. fusiforme G11 TaxID=708437 RepID=A0A9P6T593_9BASI|nr:hypothetical protein CROQUDRAFT_101558 [Cronartium quercuum f. sp. fusiforme G11]
MSIGTNHERQVLIPFGGHYLNLTWTYMESSNQQPAIPSSFSGTSHSHPHPSATSFSTSYNSSDTDQW